MSQNPLIFFKTCVHVVILQLMKKSSPVWKLDSQLVELGSCLEKVNVLLEQRSPTVSEAQRLLKVCAGLCLLAPVCECDANLLMYKLKV